MSVTFPTRDEFREWRRNNPHRGVPNYSGRCPLAECLKDRGADSPDVYVSWSANYESDNDDDWHDTPNWALIWLQHYDQGEELPLDDDDVMPTLPPPVASPVSEPRRPVFAVMRPW